MKKTVLVTGAIGAIGREICVHFQQNGWRVIGTDLLNTKPLHCDAYVPIDLNQLCLSESYKESCIHHFNDLLKGELNVLVNNAAIQIVKSVQSITHKDWQTTFNINVHAPFLLIQSLLSQLKASKGSVVNISSIHAKLTKPNFSAYATSKMALVGMTKALAVELGGVVRINAICPAAIDTPMLRAGFDDNISMDVLKKFHPSQSIGSTQDIAKATMFLSEENQFLNGAVLELDGGISGCLYDPR